MDFYDPYENLCNINSIYIAENIPTPETEDAFQEVFTEGCNCHDLCKIETCNCLQKYGINYDNTNDTSILNYIVVDSKPNSGLYECNLSCKCVNKLCGNRLVQFGPRKNLQIKDCILNKGKGLFTREKIVKGNFICEYAGEIINNTEALKRFKYNNENNIMNYILCVNEYFGQNKSTTFIDPGYFGNIGRYANHSCNPNCELIPIRVNNTIPKLCLFAKKDMEKNSEITFKYGDYIAINVDKYNLKPCLCGEENCKKWLPYLPELCE